MQHCNFREEYWYLPNHIFTKLISVTLNVSVGRQVWVWFWFRSYCSKTAERSSPAAWGKRFIEVFKAHMGQYHQKWCRVCPSAFYFAEFLSCSALTAFEIEPFFIKRSLFGSMELPVLSKLFLSVAYDLDSQVFSENVSCGHSPAESHAGRCGWSCCSVPLWFSTLIFWYVKPKVQRLLTNNTRQSKKLWILNLS